MPSQTKSVSFLRKFWNVEIRTALFRAVYGFLYLYRKWICLFSSHLLLFVIVIYANSCCHCCCCSTLLSGPMTRDSKFKVKLIDKRLRKKVSRHTNNYVRRKIYIIYIVWGKIVTCRRFLDTLSEIRSKYLNRSRQTAKSSKCKEKNNNNK